MEDKPCYLCIHKQDKERRILAEDEAFNLDIRVWDIKVWDCATMGGERPAINTINTPTEVSESFAPVSLKCERCGAYHYASELICKRPKHIRFDELRRIN